MHNFHSLKSGSVDTMPKWWAAQWEFQSASRSVRWGPNKWWGRWCSLNLFWNCTHTVSRPFWQLCNGRVCNVSEIWGSFCAELIFRICINLVSLCHQWKCFTPVVVLASLQYSPEFLALAELALTVPTTFPSLICWAQVCSNVFGTISCQQML